jgi:putative hydrolase of the HAD superfamily
MTRAIIFDLDDTLIEDYDATQRAFTKACQYVQQQVGVDALQLAADVYRHACQIWHNNPMFPYCDFIGISASEGLWGIFADQTGRDDQLQALHRWVPTYRMDAWSRGLADHGIQDSELTGKVAQEFFNVRRSYSIFADVEPVLRELCQNYKLAILTNGASDLQREKLVQSDLEHYFDVVAVSGEVGIGKPNVEVFTYVLERLAVGPEEAIMVGDSLARDILGAHRSGMRGIWINRLGRSCSAQYAPLIHASITNLYALQSFL